MYLCTCVCVCVYARLACDRLDVLVHAGAGRKAGPQVCLGRARVYPLAGGKQEASEKSKPTDGSFSESIHKRSM